MATVNSEIEVQSPLAVTRPASDVVVRDAVERRGSGDEQVAFSSADSVAQPSAAVSATSASVLFSSILFASASDRDRVASAVSPDFFADLNLDQIVEAVVAGKQEYDLKPFFYVPLVDLAAIHYRHEVMRDLEQESARAAVNRFADEMRRMRANLERREKSYYAREKQRWFVDAGAIYCAAVEELERGLGTANLLSAGFVAFRHYLTAYIRSPSYRDFRKQTEDLKADLTAIEYSLWIADSGVRVRKYAGESDYTEEVLDTFERFRQRDPNEKTAAPAPSADLNHVEAAVLELVAKLYPEIFARLVDYSQTHADYLDSIIAYFDREVQFYIAYLDSLDILRAIDLGFCYPEMSLDEKTVSSTASFDLALAFKLAKEKVPVVCNDFELTGKERIFVISGPNQGGKTTFARTFGQLHFLARLGCPVPGRVAKLFLCDSLFVHFEREENIQNRRGKLQDDLVRIHAILDGATSRSIIIMNEIFTSTSLSDAIFLGRKVLERIIALDALCVCVTFMDELASLSVQTVSVVSTVVPENPAQRTYRIIRRPADGMAYAMAIAEKYRLTEVDLKERLKS